MNATPEIELKWSSHRIEFEKLPVYRAPIDTLDQRLVQQFLDSRKKNAEVKPKQELMRDYSLIAEEHHQFYPTHAGILLFGKEPQFYLSEAMIICCHFNGIEGREAIASLDCEGTLLNQFHQAHNFILSRLTKSFSIRGMMREEKLEIPEIAFREALLNMIIHRNYHLSSPSKIFIYDDRLEFVSPGDFFGPIKPDQLQGMTYLRNPAICKIFRELGLVEKMGTGFIQIFKSYENWGLPPPQIIEWPNFVKCILPRPYQGILSSTKVLREEPDVLSLYHVQAEITIHDIMKNWAVSRATAQRWLQALVKQQKIKRIGKTRNVRYRKA